MKHLKNLALVIVLLLTFTLTVDAASGSIKASTSTRTATVGSTFTVTVKVSSTEALGSWQFGVSYDSANISLVSGDTSVAGYGDGSMKTKSYTYKFKAIKSGSANIRIASPAMVSWNDDSNLFTPSSNSVSVSVKTQAEIEASYSKDNYLKSLTVQGYEITPAFDKETTSYKVSVPDTLEEIKVSASVNDSRSRVSGTGTINISEGSNKVEVVVTAQNGSVRTYTIMVDVKDLNPISVRVDNEEYTIVKKADLLTGPVGYVSTTIKIDEIEVPAYKSEVVKMILVGLKDKDANISMFIYDADNKTYTPYREIKGSSITIFPKKIEETPKGFTKTNIKIGDKEYEALKSDSIQGFYLVYGMNLETGKSDYYVYDEDLSSFVGYAKESFDEIYAAQDEYKLYLLATGGVAVIFFLITLILSGKNSKLKKIIRKISEAQNEKTETSYDEKDVESKNKKKKETSKKENKENE